jgi:hypothetical protein
MPTENEGWVRSVIEALFNQKRVDLMGTFYSPDCRGGSPEGPFEGKARRPPSPSSSEQAIDGLTILRGHPAGCELSFRSRLETPCRSVRIPFTAW